MTRLSAAELASLFLVLFTAGLAGALAADGMRLVQWLGAAAAVSGSIALAVAVRVWPTPARGAR